MKKNRRIHGLSPCVLKMLRIMKLTVFLMLTSFLVVFASESYSQTTKLSLTVEEISLEDFLTKIEDESEFHFFFTGEINVNTKISGEFIDKKITEILDEVTKEVGIQYEVIGKQIVLSTENSTKGINQNKVISGKVTDDLDVPLPGVSIVIKGTTTGVISDIDGNYAIPDVPVGSSLVFSFVGMKTQTITVNETSIIDVILEMNAIGLNEVIAVGFATQKRVNLTGAVGSLKSDALESRPVSNATQMLQGLVGGLNISQGGGGSLDDRPSINVRGIGSIGDGSSAKTLILIDGMEGDISAINPQDIEGISVLKDAAASSIYGSRAPFGVVLVTTKKGKAGKMVVNYNNSFRSSSPIKMPEMMDSYTFANYFNDGCYNIPGWGAHFGEEQLQKIKDYQDGKITESIIPNPGNPQYWADGYRYGNDNVDWYKALYRDRSFSQEHNLSFSGGTNKLQYYASANILDKDGLMEYNRDTFKRYATTLKLTAQLTSYLHANVSTRYVREDFGRPAFLTDELHADIGRQGWPVLPLYDPNGYLYSSPAPPLNLRDGGRDKSQKDWLYQQGQLVLEPVKNWKTFAEINYRTRNDFRHWDSQKTFNHDVDGNPVPVQRETEVREIASRENYLNTNIYSEYSKTINDAHYVKVLVGFQSEKSKWRNVIAQRAGIIVPELPSINTTSGNDASGSVVPPYVEGKSDTWATAGYFGRINYNYKERYLIEMNLRYDGTSRFQGDDRWNYFPSLSAGWNIAKESFWNSYTDILSAFKIRASYGELGNQNTNSRYPTYSTMPIGISNGSWLVNGAKPNTSSSPSLIGTSLTWETVKSYNLGLDVAAINNRLTGSLDLFTRKTLGMVGPAPELPSILGTNVPKVNNTDLKTYGFELELNWQDKLDNGLGYNIKFILSDSQTEITKYPNTTGRLDSWRKGETTGDIWGYETVGMAKSKEEMDAHIASLPDGGQNVFGSSWDAGDIMYKDLNGDGKIDEGAYTIGDHGDLRVIGNSTPRYRFSFDVSADYKGFDFRAFFQGVGKRDVWQGSYYFWGISSGFWHSTGLTAHEDYFRPEEDHVLGQNMNSYYPRPRFDSSNGNRQVQTRYLQNGAYIRLKNIQLGYTLPKSITERIKLSKVRVFVSGENLWTGTKMSDLFDPETARAGAGNSTGSGGNTYPLSKTISAGVNINF
jgi:TonB-linked SusC/RagA family outer membrane protein